MGDATKLSARVRQDLEEAGYDVDKLFATESGYELFSLWLHWNGIIGYTSAIIDALDSIRDAKR